MADNEERGTYDIAVRCENCGYKGEMTLYLGSPVRQRDDALCVTCPQCECRTIVPDLPERGAEETWYVEVPSPRYIEVEPAVPSWPERPYHTTAEPWPMPGLSETWCACGGCTPIQYSVAERRKPYR